MPRVTYSRFRRPGLWIIAMGLLVSLWLPLQAVAQDDDQQPQIHVVLPGETAVGIAARYGVSLMQLVEANNLRSLKPAVGTELVIPAPQGKASRIHLVQYWDTLSSLAASYGVSVDDIMRANRLIRPDGLYVGQRLIIPEPDENGPAMGEPTGQRSLFTFPSTPTPTACRAGCAQISITNPDRRAVVTSPVWVEGMGTGYEQSLVVRVLDATGYEIGKGTAQIDGQLGEVGPYAGVVTYTAPASTQPGRIQVYSQSPGDGAIEQLASVVVTLQGSQLDEAVEQLKAALEGKDYETLSAMMLDTWNLAFYPSMGFDLGKDQALTFMRANFIEPGRVFVDLSVDARRLLAGQISLPPDVTHLVFSTGWGADQSDDALLLFSTDDAGQARWSGLIYIVGALRPY
jgi:LysM repeat protein